MSDQTEESSSPQQTKDSARSLSEMFIRRKKAVFGVSVGVAACLVLAVGVYGRQTTSQGLAKDDSGSGRSSYLGEMEYSESVASLDSLIEVEQKEPESEEEEVSEEVEVASTEENAVVAETKAASTERETLEAETKVASTEKETLEAETKVASTEKEDKKKSSLKQSSEEQSEEPQVPDAAIDEKMAQEFLDTFSGSMFALLDGWYGSGSTFDYGNLDNGQAYSIAALSLIEQDGDIYGGGVTTYCCLNNVLYPIQEDTGQVGLDENSSDTLRFASHTIRLVSARYLSDVSIVSEESEQDELPITSVEELNRYLADLSEEDEEVRAAEEDEKTRRIWGRRIVEEEEEEPLLTVYDVGNGTYRVEIEGKEEAEAEVFYISAEDADLDLYILLEEEQLEQYTEILENLFAEEYPLNEFVEFESESYGTLIRKSEDSAEQYYLKVIPEDDPVRSEEVTVVVDEIAEEPDAEGAYAVTMTYRAKKSKREYQLQCSLVPDETALNGCRLGEEGFMPTDETMEKKEESDAEKEELQEEKKVNPEEEQIPEENMEPESESVPEEDTGETGTDGE